MKRPDLVIFDCDGVLVDTEPASNTALSANLTRYGLMLSVAECTKMFTGWSLANVAIEATKLGATLPPNWIEEIHEDEYVLLRQGVPAMGGIHDVLDQLDTAEIPFCVASNGSEDKMAITLGQTGLLERFDGAMFSAHTLKISKPDPALFLAALDGAVNPNSLAKETPALTPEYRHWIERSPFFALASVGVGGLDCSPRGDAEGQLFHILDEKTLAIPDRRGNNRLDTLRNIVSDPRVALLFLIPGIEECLRINGRATITTEPELIQSFTVGATTPLSVVLVEIDAVYFQCARALKRANLWDPAAQLAKGEVPTAGQMTKGAAPNFNAETYDAELPTRQQSSLY